MRRAIESPTPSPSLTWNGGLLNWRMGGVLSGGAAKAPVVLVVEDRVVVSEDIGRLWRGVHANPCEPSLDMS
jgi:hypothetical protein